MLEKLKTLLISYRNPAHWMKNVVWRFPSTSYPGKIVFIVGCPRSGTTLLQRMLAVHSQLFSVEWETGLFTPRNIFEQGRSHFGLSGEPLRRLFRDSRDIIDFFAKGVEHLALQNEGKIFVEKTPQHIFQLPMILKHFPHGRVIHVIRDGRDCYRSARSHRGIPQCKSVARFARYWKKCMHMQMSCEEHERLFAIHYENLVDEPRDVLDSIMTFLGLEMEEAQLSPARIGNDKRTEMKGFSRLSKKIDASSVGSWKGVLSEKDVRTFSRIALPELRYYGYLADDEPGGES